MMKKAEELGKKLLLPIDTVAADGFPNPIDAEIETMSFQQTQFLMTKKDLILDLRLVSYSLMQLRTLRQ